MILRATGSNVLILWIWSELASQVSYNSLKLNPAWHPPFVEGLVVYYL